MVKSAWFRYLAIFTKWSNSRLVKLNQWSNLTTGHIQNWLNPKLVKFDHWSNSQVVKPAQFRYLAISTKWSNSGLVKIDQWSKLTTGQILKLSNFLKTCRFHESRSVFENVRWIGAYLWNTENSQGLFLEPETFRGLFLEPEIFRGLWGPHGDSGTTFVAQEFNVAVRMCPLISAAAPPSGSEGNYRRVLGQFVLP